MRKFAIMAVTLAALAAGCSSDGYSGGSSVSSSSSFYYGHGWYNDPYYYNNYYPPGGVVVVPPPGTLPGRPVSPEQPIARPPANGASTLPAGPSTGNLPSTRPTPSTSNRSRMPSSQPRTSSFSSRASMPSARRGMGGGGRRR